MLNEEISKVYIDIFKKKKFSNLQMVPVQKPVAVALPGALARKNAWLKQPEA